MRSSESRILTTHAGSLPRPRELVELQLRAARGEAVDAAALAHARLRGNEPPAVESPTFSRWPSGAGQRDGADPIAGAILPRR